MTGGTLPAATIANSSLCFLSIMIKLTLKTLLCQQGFQGDCNAVKADPFNPNYSAYAAILTTIVNARRRLSLQGHSARSNPHLYSRHCEGSCPKQSPAFITRDCHITPLLAMTPDARHCEIFATIVENIEAISWKDCFHFPQLGLWLTLLEMTIMCYLI